MGPLLHDESLVQDVLQGLPTASSTSTFTNAEIYAKLNKIGLSKNIILALQAAQTDMPPIDAFPKSHIVTFKYYAGVISFLDDNYIKV